MFDKSKNIENSIKALLKMMKDDNVDFGNYRFEIDKKGNIIAVNHQEEKYYIIYGERLTDIMAFLIINDEESLSEIGIAIISVIDGVFETGLFTSQYNRKGNIIVTYDEDYGRKIFPRKC